MVKKLNNTINCVVRYNCCMGYQLCFSLLFFDHHVNDGHPEEYG